MKQGTKFLSLLLVFVMVFSMLPSTNVLLAAELNSYTGVTSFAEGKQNLIIDTSSSGITYTYNKEYVTITTTNASDPYFTVNLVDASMKDKVMAIKYKGTAGTSIANAWLYPDSTAGGWGPSAAGLFSSSKMVCDGLWNLTTYTVSDELMGADHTSVGTATQRNATITSMRVGANASLNKTISVAYIGFFDSIAQAKEYDALFCSVYNDVAPSRIDIIPHGLHFVPVISYDFQEDAVTNGLSLVGSNTNLNSEILVGRGAGESKFVVEGSNKYLRLKYDSIQVNKHFYNNAAFSFSADVKPDETAGHFAGFIFNYGYEHDFTLNKFYETNGLDGENSVGNSGVSVNIHPTQIELCVMTYDEISRKLSQIKYTHTLEKNIGDAFHKFKVVDDANGRMRFMIDGEVFAYIEYSNPRQLSASVIDYNERYYRNATIFDGEGIERVSTDKAMISYVKSMAIGSRYRAICLDNIYISNVGSADPSFSLSSNTVTENDIITAYVNYGDRIYSKDLSIAIYNKGDSYGSGIGKVEPMYKISLNKQNSVKFPKLSAGDYFAIIMDGNRFNGNEVAFTVTDVAKTAHIYIDDTETVIGKTIKIPVVLNNNAGLKSLSVNVSWDSKSFAPVNAINGIVMGSAAFNAVKNSSSYTLSWSGTTNTTAKGIIAYVELQVKPEAKLGDNTVNIYVSSALSGSNDVTSKVITAPGQVKVKDSTLKFDGISLSLSSDITVKYMVNKDILDNAGYKNPYVEATFGSKTRKIEAGTTSISGAAYYTFAFEEVTPQMMNDTIYATLKATKDGELCSGKTKEYSVATYIYNKITTTDPSFRKLLVDMLNYGSASQIYRGYKTNELVNAKLTTEQKKNGTDSLRELKTVKSAPTANANDKAKWVGMGLLLDNKVAIRGYFDTELTSGFSVRVTNNSGSLLGTITSDKFTIVSTSGNSKRYSFVYDGLGVSQMSEVVKMTVYDDAGKAISGTYVYSIESYIYTAKDNSDENLANLSKTIIKYGDAAANYINSQKTTFGTKTPADIGTNFYAKITVGGKALALSNSNVVLDIPSSTVASQIWKFIRLENGAYKIINNSTGKALLADGAGKVDETNVSTGTISDDLSQQWFLYDEGTTFTFRPAHCDNLVMDVYMADYNKGTNIQLFTNSGAENQRFFVAERTSTVNIAETPKENTITDSQLINMIMEQAQVVSDYMRKNRFIYGDAAINPAHNWGALDPSLASDPSEKIVSCDRFVDWVLYRVGFTDQIYDHGMTVRSLVPWCQEHNFAKITSVSSLKAGDIVFVNPDSAGYAKHVFLCASSRDSSGRYLRYDAGSNDRITGTTGTEVTAGRQPFREGISGFMYAYRPNVSKLPQTNTKVYAKPEATDALPVEGAQTLFTKADITWQGGAELYTVPYKYQPGIGFNQYEFHATVTTAPSSSDTNYWNACFIGARLPGANYSPNADKGGIWAAFTGTTASIYVGAESWPNRSASVSLPLSISNPQKIVVTDDGEFIKYFIIVDGVKYLVFSVTVDAKSDGLAIWDKNNNIVAYLDGNINDYGYFSMFTHLSNTTVTNIAVKGGIY